MHEPERVRGIFSLHNFNGGYEMKHLMKAASGIELHRLKLEEKKIARIFRELHLDDIDQKRLKQLIDMRNSILHPSGTILCQTRDDLDVLINEQYDLVYKISIKAASVYVDLVESHYGKITESDLTGWDSSPDIEAYVVREYELSSVDIDSIKLGLSGAIV
jgi:hypothetical protein